MPNIELDFTVGEDVIIKPLDRYPGRVVGIYFGARGLEYNVRYYSNGKSEEVYFVASEMEAA